MLRLYAGQLVGPAPRFPRAIESGIDQYLVERASMSVTGTASGW